MKFVIAITGLLSLIPVLVLGSCELCPNFDESFFVSMSRLYPDRRSLRMLQYVSCGFFVTAYQESFSNAAEICRLVQYGSTLFCGCDLACSTCPDGSTYPDLDAFPDYGAALEEVEMDERLLFFDKPQTCRELVNQMGMEVATQGYYVGLDGETNYAKDVDFCGVAGMACGCQVGVKAEMGADTTEISDAANATTTDGPPKGTSTETSDKAESLDTPNATTSGPPKGTSTETSDTSQMFALLHSTASATMLLAVFLWFLLL